ncbi:hypothetical protein [Microbacterium sp. RURRCA19A]|uniref:hypothetical protein n=1 Tax=Microbacterium sp. RURRCA19A TaxID=1907391 RepID=UPI00095711C8|nr:hypothetical protein [Microbacterium sp. RURRCA19A]SIR77492.1 hypothetical protein SAMN05880568_1408 [Microbacterium sp. RURRCA19A]
MVVLDLLAAIAAASVAGAALFLAHGRHGDDRGGPRAELVRYMGVAALAALACSLANVVEVAGGGRFAAAVGNATNVVTVGLAWAGARRLNARRGIGAATTGAVGILMLAVTFVVPADEATLLKTVGLVVFAVLAAVEFARRPVSDLAGARILVATLVVFGAFNLYRLVVGVTAGMTSALWHVTASTQITTLLSALAIVGMGFGSVLLGRQLDDDPSPGTRAHDRRILRLTAEDILRDHQRVHVMIARIPEIDLIRAAHSAGRAEEMITVLVDAAHEALPGSSSGVPARDTVFVLHAGSTPRTEAEAAVRRIFAGQMPLIDYTDTPDVTFEHHTVVDVHDLSLLMESRRLRPGSGAVPHV